jgi:hypothetical protein
MRLAIWVLTVLIRYGMPVVTNQSPWLMEAAWTPHEHPISLELELVDVVESQDVAGSVGVFDDRFHGFRHAASLNGGYLSVINSIE